MARDCAICERKGKYVRDERNKVAPGYIKLPVACLYEILWVDVAVGFDDDDG